MLKVSKTSLIILAIIFGAAVEPASDKLFEIAKSIEIFTNVYKEINTHYVDELDPERMMKVAIDAMLDDLDPYTRYISEADIENFRLSQEGKYAGFGARVKNIEDKAIVVDIYPSSPAEKGGLKITDRVIAIDGQSTKGKSSGQIHRFLRGAPGTDVGLTVERRGEKEPIEISLTREEIKVPSVSHSTIIDGDIAYVSLRSFTMNCGAEVRKAFADLDKEENIKGFILDLRGNGGGLLREAVNVCNIFLPKGELVASTKGKVKKRDRSYSTSGNAFDEKRPVAILIDKNSASASEIVAGTIQDLDRGVIMGQLSYGKGLVQNTQEVGYNSQVKMTTAKYYIPSGRCIQSVAYKDGEPIQVADSLRSDFKTRNGRVVKDGGGVMPDVKLVPFDDGSLMSYLSNQGIIFNYVTQFIESQGMKEMPDGFSYDDFGSFVDYLKESGQQYISPTEKMLRKLRKNAKKYDLEDQLKEEIASIEAKLNANELDDVAKNEAAIKRLIELEIANRFDLTVEFSSYKVDSDPEVIEASALLKDTPRYEQILSK